MSVPLSEAGETHSTAHAEGPEIVAAPGAISDSRAWKPTPLFWGVGAVFAIISLIGLFSGGFGSFLIVAGLIGFITAIWAVATRHASWANIPADRTVRAAAIGASALALVIGVAVSASGHSSPSASNADFGAPSSVSSSHTAGSLPPSATSTRTPIPTRTPSPTPTPVVALVDYAAMTVSAAQSDLRSHGLIVSMKTSDGQAPPSDWTGWTIVGESPSAGTPIYAGSTVTLVLSPPAPVHVAPPAAPAPPADPAPASPGNGATALCNDGSYSYAAHHQGACSHHGGVAVFYK